MADEKEKPESAAEKAIATFINKRFTEYSRGRWAEEREWFESGLFYQQKQWLEKDATNAIDAANEESGMNVLNPQLTVRMQLFGLGITKDSVAFDHSTDEVPEVQPPQMGPDGQPVQQPPAVENIPSPRLDTELPLIFDVYLPRDAKDSHFGRMWRSMRLLFVVCVE
jgi:hypothetical protein